MQEVNNIPVYAVILAGGSGTRFWPKSRQMVPKQFCKLGGSPRTMMQETVARIDQFIPPEKRIVVTNKKLIERTKENLGETVHHYIAEPSAKNTTAALCLAALEIKKLEDNGPAIMISLHADHLIRNVDLFLETLKQAAKTANKHLLTLIGIEPRQPSTSFGYIKKGVELDNSPGMQVDSFLEKPNLSIAKEYVESGQFLWNSGLFTWRIDTFLEELRKFKPEIVETLENTQSKLPEKLFSKSRDNDLNQAFASLESIAIDHALLEKSQKVAVVPGNFDWQDVGSWDSLDKCFDTDSEGNYKHGNPILIDCQDSTFDSDGPLIAGIGLKDMVVVSSGNAVLVCPKSRSQEVKKIVAQLKEGNRTDYF